MLGEQGPVGILLSGTAGLGKTRLGIEALRLAETAGLATARVVASGAAAEVPLGVLAPLLPTSGDRPERPSDVLHWAGKALGDYGGDRRLCLFVDDAHLVDDASAIVLHQVAAGGSIVVVATMRSDLVAPDPILAMWKDGLAERIDVQPLDRTELNDLVTAALGGPIDGATRRDLWEASHGNPLFLRELVLGALQAGYLRAESGVWRLQRRLSTSPRLGEIVTARHGDLEPGERHTLELLAVGGPLGFDLLVSMVGAELLDQLARKGLVELRTEDRRRPLGLAHPLHGEVLRDTMSAVSRLAASRQLADALEATGCHRREDVLQLAVLRLEGGGSVHPVLMLEAAQRAWFLHDRELAERLAREARAVGGGVDAGLLLGEVVASFGRHHEAAELLAGVAAEAQSDEHRALVAMARADSLYWGSGRRGDAAQVLRAVEQELDDPIWRGEVVATRATHDLLAGRPAEALGVVSDLLNSEGRALVEAAIVAAPALAVSGRTSEALSVAERAFVVHLGLGDQRVMSPPGIHVVSAAFALGESGRLADAEVTARNGYDAAVDLRVAFGQAWFALILGRVALVQGRPVTADRWFAESAGLYGDLGHDGPRRWCMAGRILAAAMRGDDASAGAALAQLDAIGPTPMLMMEADVGRARAWRAAVAGDLGDARALLQAAADVAEDGGSFSLAASALHDLARLGRSDVAAPRLASIAPSVDGDLMPVRVAHAVGLVSGDIEALENAADRFEKLGASLFAAEALARAAVLLRRRGEARRAERAAAKSAALAGHCEGARTPDLAVGPAVGALTPRERETAGLAAVGMSSKQIAERLSVSVRTVDNHLQRIYVKLGITARSELADALGAPPTPRN